MCIYIAVRWRGRLRTFCSAEPLATEGCPATASTFGGACSPSATWCIAVFAAAEQCAPAVAAAAADYYCSPAATQRNAVPSSSSVLLQNTAAAGAATV